MAGGSGRTMEMASNRFQRFVQSQCSDPNSCKRPSECNDQCRNAQQSSGEGSQEAIAVLVVCESGRGGGANEKCLKRIVEVSQSQRYSEL